MSKILRRPMFRGGPVDSRGTGITTGLDQPRIGARTGRFFGDTGNPFVPKPITRQGVIDAYTPRGIPQSFLDFFQSNVESRKPSGRFTTKGPGATLKDAEGLLADASGAILSDENLGDAEFDFRDSIRELRPEGRAFPDKEPERDTGLEAIRQKNIEEIDNSPTVVKTPKSDDDEPEVTMTDLEKALGLDRARQEYAADALAAASKAFFEGKGFGAIADAAAVKSKAPDIKRLAAIEEFKAEKAKELYKEKLDAQARAKAGTIGNLQKDINFLKGLRGADRTAALGKLGYKAPSLSAAIKELKITGQAPDAATIINLAELYIGPDFKGVVDVTEELSTKPAGTYIANDASALVIIDEQGKSRLQKL
jgi:hypothetical protein